MKIRARGVQWLDAAAMAASLAGGSAAAQQLSGEISPLELAMAISVGCERLEVDLAKVEGIEMDEGIDEVVARGVQRGFVLRSMGVDPCVLGDTQRRQETEAGALLREATR